MLGGMSRGSAKGTGEEQGLRSIKAFVRAGLSKGLIPSPCLTLLAVLARLWDALRPEANTQVHRALHLSFAI